MNDVVLREFWPLAIGLVAGVAVALPAARALSSALYGVSPRDPLTFATAFTALLIAGVLATVLPARRAAALDVMNILRGP